MDTHRGTTRRHLANSPFKPPPQEPLKEFAAGDRVSHDREGVGRVTKIEDSGDALVDFGTARLRIPPPYTKLHLL